MHDCDNVRPRLLIGVGQIVKLRKARLLARRSVDIEAACCPCTTTASTDLSPSFAPARATRIRGRSVAPWAAAETCAKERADARSAAETWERHCSQLALWPGAAHAEQHVAARAVLSKLRNEPRIVEFGYLPRGFSAPRALIDVMRPELAFELVLRDKLGAALGELAAVRAVWGRLRLWGAQLLRVREKEAARTTKALCRLTSRTGPPHLQCAPRTPPVRRSRRRLGARPGAGAPAPRRHLAKLPSFVLVVPSRFAAKVRFVLPLFSLFSVFLVLHVLSFARTARSVE